MFLAAVLAALTLAPGPERPTVASADSVRWAASGELSFTDVSGNQALTLLATKLDLRRQSRVLELRTQAGVRYGRSDGHTAAEDYTSGLEARFLPQARLSPFVQVTAVRDDIKEIDLRLAAAAGADINVVRDTARQLSFGVALLQDYENFAVAPDSSTPESRSLTRINLRLQGAVPLTGGVRLVHSTTLQPVASDLGDYLLTTQTALRVMLSRRFALQTTWQFNRDTSPAPGVTFRNDRTLTVGLLIETR